MKKYLVVFGEGYFESVVYLVSASDEKDAEQKARDKKPINNYLTRIVEIDMCEDVVKIFEQS